MYNPLLMTFLAVADCGSFTKASERLYISSTAVMKQINALEQHLELKLVERTSAGIRLTPAGEVIYRDAKFMIDYSKNPSMRPTPPHGATIPPSAWVRRFSIRQSHLWIFGIASTRSSRTTSCILFRLRTITRGSCRKSKSWEKSSIFSSVSVIPRHGFPAAAFCRSADTRS